MRSGWDAEMALRDATRRVRVSLSRRFTGKVVFSEGAAPTLGTVAEV